MINDTSEKSLLESLFHFLHVNELLDRVLLVTNRLSGDSLTSLCGRNTISLSAFENHPKICLSSQIDLEGNETFHNMALSFNIEAIKLARQVLSTIHHEFMNLPPFLCSALSPISEPQRKLMILRFTLINIGVVAIADISDAAAFWNFITSSNDAQLTLAHKPLVSLELGNVDILRLIKSNMRVLKHFQFSVGNIVEKPEAYIAKVGENKPIVLGFGGKGKYLHIFEIINRMLKHNEQKY